MYDMIGLLSRVSAEFRHLDAPLREHYASLPGFALKTPEEIEGYAGGSGTLAKLWAFVTETDVVLHLVGEIPGSSPSSDRVEDFLCQEPELRSWIEQNHLAKSSWTYTQWEVYLALYRKSLRPTTKIFVCLFDAPAKNVLDFVTRQTLADTGPLKNPQALAVKRHLDTLKSFGCHPEISFHDQTQLIIRLEKSDLSYVVRGFQQQALVPVESLAQRFRYSSPANALRSWPQTIGRSNQWLDRPELPQIIGRIRSRQSSVTLLLGLPGSGKSALLARLTEQLATSHEVVAIKADDLPNTVTKPEELDAELGLPVGTDAITSIRRLAQDRPVVVLIDQLDALAQLVVESPLRLRVLIRLIEQLADQSRIQIVASCRSFERTHDPMLRRIKADELELELPAWTDVAAMLIDAGIDGSAWNPELQESLRNPQALNLFVSLHESDPEISALSNYQQMLDRLWEMRIERAPTDMAQVLERVVDAVTNQEQPRVPKVRLNLSTQQLNYLVASGFLEQSGPSVGFRHQTLYEHARVRSFARAPQLFIDAVHSKQHNLRARPQFWHGLNYLRAADPAGYDLALDSLWRYDELRSHVCMLLLDFMGQQQTLRASEKVCVGAALDDAGWTRRCLSAIARNHDWFAWLAAGRLPALMQGSADIQVPVSILLEAAIKINPDRVLELMQHYWWPNPERDWLLFSVLGQLLEWNQMAVAALIKLVRRYDLIDWRLESITSKVRSQLPNEAVFVLRAWLDRRSTLDQGEGNHPVQTPRWSRAVLITDWRRPPRFEHKPIRDLIQNSSLHVIDFAVVAPEQFSRQIWPWFLAFLQTSVSGESSTVLIGYPRNNILGVDLDEQSATDNGIVHGLDTALRAWAAEDPNASLAFLRSHFAVNDYTAQRLIARALVTICPHAPIDVLDYLRRDDRRLMLGEGPKFWNDSWALIAAISQNASTEQLEDLEQVLINWSPYRPEVATDEPDLREQRELWRRRDRLCLLRAVPESHRSRELRELIEIETAAVPGSEPAPEHPIRILSPIGSPIRMADMQFMTDGELVDLLRGFPDHTGWSHPDGGLRGGAIQLGRELGELAKVDPGRAICVIDRLLQSVEHPIEYARGAEAVLLVVSQAADSGRCLAFAQRLLDAGLGANPSFRHDFAYAMWHVLEWVSELPESFIGLLESWIEVAQAPNNLSTDPAEEPSATDTRSVLLQSGGSIALPSGNYPILRALGRACLQVQSPRSLADRWLGILEAHVERSEDPEVWCALYRELQFPGSCDSVRAAGFLTRLLVRHPQVMQHALSAHIIAEALHWAGEAQALHWIDCFAALPHPLSQQAAAELLALRHYWHPDDRATTLRFHAAIEDPITLAPDANRVQLGLAHVVATFWREPDQQVRAHAHWLALAACPGEMHPSALMEVFDTRHDSRLAPDPMVRALLAAVYGYPTLLRQSGNEDLVKQMAWLLEELGGWEAELIGGLAIRIVDEIGDAHAAHLMDEALTDVLLLLQEHQSKAVQALGTELLERLLEHGAAFAQNLVNDIDRRMA